MGEVIVKVKIEEMKKIVYSNNYSISDLRKIPYTCNVCNDAITLGNGGKVCEKTMYYLKKENEVEGEENYFVCGECLEKMIGKVVRIWHVWEGDV